MKLHNKNPFIKQALEVLAPLGLDNAVHPDKIRLNDATNYLAKVMHEERADDPTDEVLEHLGVSKDNAAFVASLTAAFKEPKPDAAITERLKVEAACRVDPKLIAKHLDKLKAWANADLDEQAASV